MLSDIVNIALWIAATVVLAVVIVGYVRSSAAERIHEVELHEQWIDALEKVSELRDAYIERGKTIDATQIVVEKWKRRAALKTAEVHRLRRLLRGLDVKEVMAER